MNVSSGSFVAPTATVELEIKGKLKRTAIIGDGPVDATFKAIKKLTGLQPRLVNFSIGSITGGTDALGECTVRLEYEGHEVLGQGAHSDIIVASAKAYINAINKALDFSQRTKVRI
jgi:2-isopropylmalate synthase